MRVRNDYMCGVCVAIDFKVHVTRAPGKNRCSCDKQDFQDTVHCLSPEKL
jgi:hypothetical protein